MHVKWLDFDLQGHKTLCSGLLCWKTKKGQNFQFFTKNHGLTPLEKCQFSTFLNRCIFSLKWLDFYLQAHKTLCFGLFCCKTKQDHGFLFLTKNHRLTPLKKCQFSTFENQCFSSLNWQVFYPEGHKTPCFGLFYWKTKQEQNFQFLTKNHGLTPLENAKFSTCLNPCFVVLNG